jgi:hypothetical protein
MSNFKNELASLIAAEAVASRFDPERMSILIERLAVVLGLVVTIAADGDPELIDTLIAGAEARALEEAVARSPLIVSLRALAS